MTADTRSREELLAENRELRVRLEEAEETLEAIRSGAVDALVISTPHADQVFTLKGADHSYRVLVETMHAGTATMTVDGTIVYCNRYLADMLQVPPEKVVGSLFSSYVVPEDLPRLALIPGASTPFDKEEIALMTGKGNRLQVLFSCCPVDLPGSQGMGVVLTDITPQKQMEERLRLLNEELEQRVQDRTAELLKKNADLEQMNRLFVGRELRIVELKEKIILLESESRTTGGPYAAAGGGDRQK